MTELIEPTEAKPEEVEPDDADVLGEDDDNEPEEVDQ